MSSMSLKSGFSSLDELNSCNLYIIKGESKILTCTILLTNYYYLDDIRLKTALKLLRLRANKTFEAKALSWLTIGFSFGKSVSIMKA